MQDKLKEDELYMKDGPHLTPIQNPSVPFHATGVGEFAFPPGIECDTFRVVGEAGQTLMVITPEGEILLGEDRLPLDRLLEGLKNAVAAVEMLRDCYSSYGKERE